MRLPSQEESAALRDRLGGMEAELRARDAMLRDAEGRLVAVDVRSRTDMAETQVGRGVLLFVCVRGGGARAGGGQGRVAGPG